MADDHWRNTQKLVRFFFLDARAFAGFLLLLVHARPWTLTVAVFILILFWVLEKKGLTFGGACRAFRSWLLGSIRPSNSRRTRRRLIDYGDR
jgi:intracellular multiplication protein IcmT